MPEPLPDSVNDGLGDAVMLEVLVVVDEELVLPVTETVTDEQELAVDDFVPVCDGEAEGVADCVLLVDGDAVPVGDLPGVLVVLADKDALPDTVSVADGSGDREDVVDPVDVFVFVSEKLGDPDTDAEGVEEDETRTETETRGEGETLLLKSADRDLKADTEAADDADGDFDVDTDEDSVAVTDAVRDNRPVKDTELDTDGELVEERDASMLTETRALLVRTDETDGCDDVVTDGVEERLLGAERDSLGEEVDVDETEVVFEIELDAVLLVDGEILLVDVLLDTAVTVNDADFVDDADDSAVRVAPLDRVDEPLADGVLDADALGLEAAVRDADLVLVWERDVVADEHADGVPVLVLEDLPETEAVRDVDTVAENVMVRAGVLVATLDAVGEEEGRGDRVDVLDDVEVPETDAEKVRTEVTVAAALDDPVDDALAVLVVVEDARAVRVAVLVGEEDRVLPAVLVTVTEGLIPTFAACRAALCEKSTDLSALKPKKWLMALEKSGAGAGATGAVLTSDAGDAPPAGDDRHAAANDKSKTRIDGID